MTSQSNQKTVDEGQPLVEHLIELRTRLLHSIVAVLIIFLPLFYFANELYAYISKPLRAYLPEGTSMIATEVASPFLTPFKLTLVLSIFIGIPYMLHQLW
ncbi:MAG: twin-arginine translocase subunit TatC, partial [Pseudomonadales bacterium]